MKILNLPLIMVYLDVKELLLLLQTGFITFSLHSFSKYLRKK